MDTEKGQEWCLSLLMHAIQLVDHLIIALTLSVLTLWVVEDSSLNSVRNSEEGPLKLSTVKGVP